MVSVDVVDLEGDHVSDQVDLRPAALLTAVTGTFLRVTVDMFGDNTAVFHSVSFTGQQSFDVGMDLEIGLRLVTAVRSRVTLRRCARLAAEWLR
jgi:hypothetical protein